MIYAGMLLAMIFSLDRFNFKALGIVLLYSLCQAFFYFTYNLDFVLQLFLASLICFLLHEYAKDDDNSFSDLFCFLQIVAISFYFFFAFFYLFSAKLYTLVYNMYTYANDLLITLDVLALIGMAYSGDRRIHS